MKNRENIQIFQGADELSLDAKGRIAIPARRREPLQAASNGHLVLTCHPHGCLLLYPSPAWEPIRDKILASSGLDRHTAAIKRLIVGQARDESMDSSGRLLVAPELRQFSGFEKKVWLVGQGSHFEIWSDRGWKQQQDVFHSLDGHLLPQGLEDLTL